MAYNRSSFNNIVLAITTFILLFTHWAFQELLDRKYGMKPKITTKSQLKAASAKTSHPADAFEINCRYSEWHRIQNYGVMRVLDYWVIGVIGLLE